MTSRRLMLLASVCALALPVAAQTLYKLIDKNGKVTYSETPPKDFDGKVIRMNIDPKANTAILPKGSTATDTETGTRKESPALSAGAEKERRKQARIEAAKKRLEEAKATLADALANPGEGDVVTVGSARRKGTGMPGAAPAPVPPQGQSTGARVIWSEEYRARIDSLEAAIKKAEEDLAAAEATD